MARLLAAISNVFFSLLLVIKSSNSQGLYLTRELVKTWLGLTENQLLITTSIVLEHKGIVAIEPKTFSGLKSLKWLYLNNNRINTIDPQTFSGLTSLIDLRLDNNQISAIQPNTFI